MCKNTSDMVNIFTRESQKNMGFPKPLTFVREHILLFKLLLSQHPPEEELSQIFLQALIITAVFMAVPQGNKQTASSLPHTASSFWTLLTQRVLLILILSQAKGSGNDLLYTTTAPAIIVWTVMPD